MHEGLYIDQRSMHKTRLVQRRPLRSGTIKIASSLTGPRHGTRRQRAGPYPRKLGRPAPPLEKVEGLYYPGSNSVARGYSPQNLVEVYSSSTNCFAVETFLNIKFFSSKTSFSKRIRDQKTCAPKNDKSERKRQKNVKTRKVRILLKKSYLRKICKMRKKC